MTGTPEEALRAAGAIVTVANDDAVKVEVEAAIAEFTAKMADHVQERTNEQTNLIMAAVTVFMHERTRQGFAPMVTCVNAVEYGCLIFPASMSQFVMAAMNSYKEPTAEGEQLPAPPDTPEPQAIDPE